MTIQQADRATGQEQDESPRDRAAAWAEAQCDFEWVRRHWDELQQYAGHWVAVAGQQVVVVEKDPDLFVQRVRAGNWERHGCAPYVFYVPATEEMAGIYPGAVNPLRK